MDSRGEARGPMGMLPTEDRPRPFRCLRVVIIFLLVLVAASVMSNRGLLRLYRMHQERATLDREVQDLISANAALADEVRALRTDPSRIEAIAREELGLVKPGDLVYEFRPWIQPSAPSGSR